MVAIHHSGSNFAEMRTMIMVTIMILASEKEKIRKEQVYCKKGILANKSNCGCIQYLDICLPTSFIPSHFLIGEHFLKIKYMSFWFEPS